MLEDRIRDAYQAADTWGPSLPRPLPVGSRPKRRGTPSWVVPLTAAAALAVLVVGLAYVVDQRKPGPDGLMLQGPPRHYLAFGGTYPTDGGRDQLSVRDSATGRLVARLGLTATEVAATGDGRTYFSATMIAGSGTSRQNPLAYGFHQITLTADGRPKKISRLPIPAVPHVDALTAAADGSKLVFSARSSRPRGAIYLADVRTGRTTLVRALPDAVIISVSMDNAGRHVAFTEFPERGGMPKARVLDLTRPDAKPIDLPVGSARAPDSVAIRPDGTGVAVGMSLGGRKPDQVVEYPLGGGAPRVLLTAPVRVEPHGDNEEAVTSGIDILDYESSGRELLVSPAGTSLSRLTVATGRVTPLAPRGPASHGIAAW